jgi:hypothetical protein
MDDRLRGRRLLLRRDARNAGVFARARASAIVLAACAVAACAGQEALAPVGVSNAGSTTSDAPTRDAGADAPSVPSPLAADFRATFTKVNRTRFISRGHLMNRFAVDIFVNPLGQEAYLAAGGNVPVGTVLVKEHFERTSGGVGSGERPTGLFVMTKREAGYDAPHGDWRWTVIGAHGEVLQDGKIESCNQCHADAPHDRIFRVDE